MKHYLIYKDSYYNNIKYLEVTEDTARFILLQESKTWMGTITHCIAPSIELLFKIHPEYKLKVNNHSQGETNVHFYNQSSS